MARAITKADILTFNGGEYDDKDRGIHFYNNHYANWKTYGIPKAQLIIADIPYQLGDNAYASNPMWYNDGDNSQGESEYAKANFFKTEETFKIPEFFHFCASLLKPEPKGSAEGKEIGGIPIITAPGTQPYDRMTNIAIAINRKSGLFSVYTDDRGCIWEWKLPDSSKMDALVVTKYKDDENNSVYRKAYRSWSQDA